MISNPSVAEALALRRELILAQIRLMELSDSKENADTQIAALGNQLGDLQRLTDEKMLELAHLRGKILALEAQFQAFVREAESAQHDAKQKEAALTALLLHEQQIVESRDKRIIFLSSRLDETEKALSWRLTKPFRALYRLGKHKGK